MYLLARNSAAQTVAWLYLVPLLTAFFSWLILSEQLSLTGIWGLLITSSGIYLGFRVPTGQEYCVDGEAIHAFKNLRREVIITYSL